MNLISEEIVFTQFKNLTLNDLVFEFIENNIDAWRALPLQMRKLMLNSPQLFTIINPIPIAKTPTFPDIIFNSVRFKFAHRDNVWNVLDLVSQ